ncbi:MAG: CD225/dispanin family protein [Actinobacteria bacterium]|nr:CD225/dispanin family protein [Actinomycetota bacterium]
MYDTPTEFDRPKSIDPDNPWEITAESLSRHGAPHEPASRTGGAADQPLAAADNDPWLSPIGDLLALDATAQNAELDWPPKPPRELLAHVGEPVRVETPAVLSKPDTHLHPAILAAIFFLPLGAVALVSALIAESAWRRGDVGEAARHAHRVGPWLTASAAVGAVVWAGAIIWLAAAVLFS